MNLAVSNIAWTLEEEAEAFALLARLGVSRIEVAPTRYWPDLSAVDEIAAKNFAIQLQNSGLEVVAFQALLFGRPEFALFGGTSAAMREYLEKTATLAGWMGARAMVFGSPKNRIVPSTLSTDEADTIAARFFRILGEHAMAHHTAFCLEPNPVAYGGNYLTHAADAARLASAAATPGIRIQIDAGELAMNAEDVDEIINRHIALVGHVHISQANLDSFEQPWKGHTRLAAALARNGYRGSCSIEMKRQPDGLVSVEKAIRFALETYASCLG